MADVKISALPAASTPLAGTEVLPIVQGGTTDKVSVANLTAGRTVDAAAVVVGAGTASAPGITFTGDTNTGVYSPGADTIALTNGGTERMRIDASGNVGIGTSSPAQRLDVGSTTGLNVIRVGGGNSGSSDGGALYCAQNGVNNVAFGNASAILGSGYSADALLYAGNAVRFSAGATERMRITAAGDVGIGNSAPVTRLDVTGISTIRSNSASWNTTPNTNYGLNFQAASTGTCHITSYSAGGSTEMAFATNSGGAAAVERARITSGGDFQFNSGYGSVATAYGCRAWVNFNGTGTVAIRASGNVSSITDNGVGDYTVNFTSAMPDANYALNGTCLLNNNTDTRGFVCSATNAGGFAPATGSSRIATVATGVGNQDFAFVNVAIFR